MTHTICAHRIMFMDVDTICASAAGNRAHRANKGVWGESSLSFSFRLTLRADQADVKGGGTGSESQPGVNVQEQETSNTHACMYTCAWPRMAG